MTQTHVATMGQQNRMALKKLGIFFATLLVWSSMADSQTWRPLANQPTFSPSTPILLTNGNVLVQDTEARDWWILKPDKSGDYRAGTWSKAANMPAGYGPLYYASAILPNEQLIVMGGEYNLGVQDDTNLGAIYHPKTNSWTSMGHPSGWSNIGDGPSVVLADGTFMLGDCCNFSQALLSGSTWSTTGASKADSNSEEGWTLLPNGKVLTVDTENGTESELFDPTTGSWSLTGDTKATLPNPCGGFVAEVGPAILRPNGTVFATGGTRHTAIYDYKAGTWKAGPNFPSGTGVMDGAGALLITGNVLVGAAPTSSSTCYGTGLKFYEFNGTTLKSVPNPPNAPNDKSYYGRMLALPSGHVLFTDGSNDMEIYTPKGSANSAWAPKITSVASTITRNTALVIKGTQFNGMSQAAAYGDDAQTATNYPLVRVTNNKTGHVFYARTYNFSSMGVATGSKSVSCTFVVPSSAETGASTLEVVANGIASSTVKVTIK